MSHEEIREWKRLNRGIKDVNAKCTNCGKMNGRHYPHEVRICKHKIDSNSTPTRMRQMTNHEIDNMEPRKV